MAAGGVRRTVLAPVLGAALLALLAGTCAVRMGRQGLAFLPRLNRADTALERTPPLVAPRPPRLARRVVLVIIDGLALRYSYGIPLLDDARRRGVDSMAISMLPTISRPNYIAILTGVPPAASGVRNNAFVRASRLDSLFARARAGGLRAAFVADDGRGVEQMLSAQIDDARYTPWPGGFVNGIAKGMAGGFDLIVLLPGAVDTAGHRAGAASDAYRDAIAATNRDLTAGLAGLDLSRDALVVVADHGHTDRGGHGGAEPVVREVPLVMAGAGVRPGALVGDAELIDVAPTVAALLGLPPPGHGLGRTLVEALDVDQPTRDAIAAADAARIARNRVISEQEAIAARGQRAAVRARRVALLVALLALAVIAFAIERRVGAIHVDWRVLVIAVPAFPLAFYALLDVAGGHFSLSALPDEGAGSRRLFHFGLVATAVHVLAAWLALRGRVVLRERLAAANALAGVGLAVALLPPALAWAWFGGGPYVEMPSPRMQFLIPALYIAVACYAIAATVTLGLEIIVFFARAVDPRQRPARG